jgi:hypothetical protein
VRGAEVVLRGRAGGDIRIHAVRRTDPSGHFRFDRLPAGEYEVSAWSKRGEVRVPLRVPGGPCVVRLP